MTRPLIIVSSKTGNTKILARGIADLAGNIELVDAKALPEELSAFNPVGLFFWCDRGMAPEDIRCAARRLSGKQIACFATMGGDPSAEKALAWMEKTSASLVEEGSNNILKGTFLSQGRIGPALFDRMTTMAGGVTPEREARRKAAETHPDRLDIENALAAWHTFFEAPADSNS